MRALTIFLWLAGPVLGCECRSWTVCELVQQPTIFIGEVIDGGVNSIRDDPWYSKANHVRFKVVESFRGVPKGTKIVDIAVTPTLGMCSPNPYFPGRTYLVVPSKWEGKLRDGLCFSGRDVVNAADTVKYVRDYFAGKSPLNVHGRVAVAPEWALVSYLLSVGQAKPLSGVRVWASEDGRSLSSVTDADGRYSLTVPARGSYDIKATLSPYNPDGATVTVGAGGCAVRDFALQSGSTVSGAVNDENGHTVKNAKVGLIALSPPKNQPDGRAWLLDAYTGQSDQGFLIKNVPVGRYLLIFNPEGPRSGRLFDMP